MTENRVRRVVLGLSENGACADLFENLSLNSIKGDLSNATTFNPSFFSLVNTFNVVPKLRIQFNTNLQKTRPQVNVNVGEVHKPSRLFIELFFNENYF
jgi:hypothetical protein